MIIIEAICVERSPNTQICSMFPIVAHVPGTLYCDWRLFFGVYSWLVVLGQFSIIYFRGLGLRIGVRVWVRVGVMVWVRVSVVVWSG